MMLYLKNQSQISINDDHIEGGKDYRTVKKRKGFTIWQDLT